MALRKNMRQTEEVGKERGQTDAVRKERRQTEAIRKEETAPGSFVIKVCRQGD